MNALVHPVCNCLGTDRVLAGPRRRTEGAQLLPLLPLQPGLLPIGAAGCVHGSGSAPGSSLTNDGRNTREWCGLPARARTNAAGGEAASSEGVRRAATPAAGSGVHLTSRF